MNLEQFKNMTVGKRIGFGNHGGYGIGGECGELASYWFSEITLDKFQFAYGKPNINAAWAIGSDCYTAWNVATQSNWGAMGFDKIDNPSFSQLKAGDIFFISARAGLSTGHVGIVYSTANNNVTTLEQNFGGARYVQLMAGANSWSYYGGFSCIVRPKQPVNNNTNDNKPKPQKKGKDMILYKIYDKSGAHKGKWFISDGVTLRYVRTPRLLGKYQEYGYPVDTIYSSELFGPKGEFDQKKVIW